jgi:hypothetical protein
MWVSHMVAASREGTPFWLRSGLHSTSRVVAVFILSAYPNHPKDQG